MKALRILIVDDDAAISELLAETLAADGHVVCGIESTEVGAVLAAVRERPDLIVIDVALGTGSGVRAIEQIRRTGPVAHLFISGDRMPAAYQALLKPFRPNDLQRAIEQAFAATRPAEIGPQPTKRAG